MTTRFKKFRFLLFIGGSGDCDYMHYFATGDVYDSKEEVIVAAKAISQEHRFFLGVGSLEVNKSS